MSVIWNTFERAMKPARRVSDCFPLPPTPTSSADDRGMHKRREMRSMCRSASSNRTRFICFEMNSSLYLPRNISTRVRMVGIVPPGS